MSYRPILLGALLTMLIALATGSGLYYMLFNIALDLPGTEVYAAFGQLILTFNLYRQ